MFEVRRAMIASRDFSAHSNGFFSPLHRVFGAAWRTKRHLSSRQSGVIAPPEKRARKRSARRKKSHEASNGGKMVF
jgi:hypothetical protein